MAKIRIGRRTGTEADAFGMYGGGLAFQDAGTLQDLGNTQVFFSDEPSADAAIDDNIASLDSAVFSLSGSFLSVDQDFNNMAGSIDSDMNSMFSDADTSAFMRDGGGRSTRLSRKEGRGSSDSSAYDTAGMYAQAQAGLAEAMNPDLESEFGESFANALQLQYQAQVNAYNDLTGMNVVKAPGTGEQVSTGAGTVNVNISGLTIQGAGDLSNVTDLSGQIETAIAQNIQRNTSPITTALKEAGFQR